MSGKSDRTLVIWCPDWPAVAGARQAGKTSSVPVAVFHANRVQTCTGAARSEGIKLGQRRRDAQSRCPDLLVITVDVDRDARLFEPVVAAVESVAPGVEILRPGLIACSSRGPARYFGSEEAAAEKIVDMVEALDVECAVGIADSLPVAVLAARQIAIVPTGRSAEFCSSLPIAELARDPAIAPPERMELVDLLIRLGLTTAGAFAALPETKVATRFGADGIVAHRLARGLAERTMSRRIIPEELAVEQQCDPPLDRVDTAAFAARALAERFHARLADAGLACTRLAISARTDRGGHLSRIWRCARPLTPAATADRLRWQLDGWLTAGRTMQPPGRTMQPPGRQLPGRQLPGGNQVADLLDDPVADEFSGPGAITMLRLEPIEAIGAGLVQYGLWGSDGQDDQRAGWSFARVQGLLGPESVLAPVLSGGRGPSERITLLPWGDEKVPLRDPAAPWPGMLPAPAPTRLSASADLGSAADTAGDTTAVSVTVLDEYGAPVSLTERGLLSGNPARLHGRRLDTCWITGWAGPWLLDERWWLTHPTDIARHRARLQVLTDGGSALLLLFGTNGWQIEGVYD